DDRRRPRLRSHHTRYGPHARARAAPGDRPPRPGRSRPGPARHVCRRRGHVGRGLRPAAAAARDELLAGDRGPQGGGRRVKPDTGRAVDVIAKKRDGGTLSPAEIRGFVQDYARGEIPDYQAAALLMAVFLRGLDEAETAALTEAMIDSG